MGKLLLSTRDLVNLALELFPVSGFISSEAMVDILSALTKLKTFRLNFDPSKHFHSWTHEARQRPPALTRVVLPALTKFDYEGNSEYLEGIVSRIDAPLDRIAVTFTNNQLMVSDISSFSDFIGRTKIPNGPYRADTFFSRFNVEISLFQRKGASDLKVLSLCIPCLWYSVDSQLSSLAQACHTLLPPLPSLELLGLYNSNLLQHAEVENLNTRCMELLLSFTTVKDLVLHEVVGSSVASSLQELVAERGTEILPALQNIFLEGFQPSGLIPEGIAKFISARELTGHPILVHHRETKQ
jgi:hypothetical protein